MGFLKIEVHEEPLTICWNMGNMFFAYVALFSVICSFRISPCAREKSGGLEVGFSTIYDMGLGKCHGHPESKRKLICQLPCGSRSCQRMLLVYCKRFGLLVTVTRTSYVSTHSCALVFKLQQRRIVCVAHPFDLT